MNKLNSKIIAARLIKLRGNRTQDEVAKDVGISKSALGMYETGARIPRDNIKLKLADYYNTSVEAIFFTK